jgi:hypothetical protein
MFSAVARLPLEGISWRFSHDPSLADIQNMFNNFIRKDFSGTSGRDIFQSASCCLLTAKDWVRFQEIVCGGF